ncbi:hypothetical protein P167DRAFT_536992 [Morchella conica CCBAS932]|uniref:FAR-17a/AIG1-like protein n=1 Tax=Morchella conica CCBAS932 TaxID=1392247 RepID=A0A3N4KSD8_9PEZI|nr:hypothetical protein P167DRAFT_536992 [Morchella conica CCBAS932]
MFLIAGLTDHIAARPMRLKSLSDLVPFFVKARATKRYHLAKYLTSRCSRIIALSISTLTFIFGFLADITLNPKLFLIKNALAVASAPLEVLISLLYWGLTAIDRTLVMPPGMHIDTFVDLSLHLFPAALLLIDALLLSPPWTVGVVPALLVPGCLATFYWFWLEHCYSYNGWYPYPIMEILKTEHRIILFAGSALTMSASTLALKWAFSRFNGQLGKAVPGDAKRR